MTDNSSNERMLQNRSRLEAPSGERGSAAPEKSGASLKRFRADEALHATGQRGPEVVLASDYDMKDVEIEMLRDWCSRASQVLPLIDRRQGTDLAEFVNSLIRGEVPPSTGAPRWYPRMTESGHETKLKCPHCSDDLICATCGWPGDPESQENGTVKP